MDQNWSKSDTLVPILAWLAVIATICVLFAMPVHAGEATQAQGVICDTAEQVEAFLELAGTGTPAHEAIAQVNETATPNACVFGRVVFEGLEEVKNVDIAEHELAIVKLAIIAVHTPMGFMPIEMTQFMAVARKQLHPARLGV